MVLLFISKLNGTKGVSMTFKEYWETHTGCEETARETWNAAIVAASDVALIHVCGPRCWDRGHGNNCDYAIEKDILKLKTEECEEEL
jgi:hypothetical protein